MGMLPAPDYDGQDGQYPSGGKVIGFIWQAIWDCLLEDGIPKSPKTIKAAVRSAVFRDHGVHANEQTIMRVILRACQRGMLSVNAKTAKNGDKQYSYSFYNINPRAIVAATLAYPGRLSLKASDPPLPSVGQILDPRPALRAVGQDDPIGG